MNQKVLHKIFVWGFLFLYLLVAGISFCHAVEFFSIGNPTVMSAVLAFAFELGLSLSLAAILLSNENKNKLLPWVLMTILTFVQVIGNVYSTFKYIALSDVDYYVYLQKPLLFWIEEVSQDTVQVIISWIIGAILPIVALFMTDMVASNLKNIQNDKSDTKEDVKEISQEKDEEIEQKEIEVPTISKIPDEPKEKETNVSLKNVVVHDKPIKTSIEKQEPVKKEPTMKINKNVEITEEPVKTEDEVANRDKKIKNGFHRADDPYFDLPTSNK